MEHKEVTDISVVVAITVLWLYIDYSFYVGDVTYWYWFSSVYYLIYFPLILGLGLALAGSYAIIKTHSEDALKHRYMASTVVLPLSWLFLLPVLLLRYTQPATTGSSPQFPAELPYVLCAAIVLQIIAIISLLTATYLRTRQKIETTIM